MPMLRALIDQIMEYKVTSVVIVLAHIAALIWAVALRKGLGPVLGLNVIVTAGILVYNANQLGSMLDYADYRLMALMAFALATLLISAAALFGWRIPTALIWTAFAGNFAMSLLFMAFALLFKMDRLF
jgi:hypothetical protein